MEFSEDDLEQVRVAIKNRLNSQLEARGWSQKKFADEIATSEATVSRWIAGKNLGQWTKLRVVCEVLGISSDDMLGLSQAQGITPEEAASYADELGACMESLSVIRESLSDFSRNKGGGS